jgi:hypothetical protein
MAANLPIRFQEVLQVIIVPLMLFIFLCVVVTVIVCYDMVFILFYSSPTWGLTPKLLGLPP